MDNNAFVFSFSTKKIYNAKYNKEVIGDFSKCGPMFYAYIGGAIKIPSNMIENSSLTCTISESYFDGMTIDYELNNGEHRFYVQEIELYQILYS